jgi:hypothetical protein
MADPEVGPILARQEAERSGHGTRLGGLARRRSVGRQFRQRLRIISFGVLAL